MNHTKKIYLDYAATTPVDARVVKVMGPYFESNYANTMSLHEMGRMSGMAVEKGRKVVADYINASPDEIFFTGSATESNNWVLKGVAFANRNKGKHIIISPIEHDCVLESARWLARNGFEIDYVKVDQYGLVDLGDLNKLIRKDTILVSIIHGNNEIGTLQNLGKIGQICRDKGTYFHTDAAQSFGKEEIDVKAMKIDLLTASSHKIYGPKGVAILYIRKGVVIETLLHGGGHENGKRSSTVNVPAVMGMVKAVEIYKNQHQTENEKLIKWRDEIIKKLLEIKGSRLNGHQTERLANNINISFEGVEGESLLMELDLKGIEVSTGSACSSTSLEPSHVLLAIGLEPQVAHGSLRISLGRWTTQKDIDYLLKTVPEVVGKFRKISPFKIW